MISSIGNTGSVSASYNITQMQERILKKIDTNGDDSVSKEEFISGRPKEVSEDQANEMWSKLDSTGKGSLTGSEFLAAMASQGPPPGAPQGPPPGPPPGESGEQGNSEASSSTTDTATTELLQALLDAIQDYEENSSSQSGSAPSDASQRFSDLFARIDTDADGSVSKDEFVSNRPMGVSEDQANEMWSKLDASGAGSLTEAQFVSAMSSQGSPPGPPPGESVGEGNASVLSSTSNTSNITASDELVHALLAAIDKYMQSSKTQNQEISTNTMSSYA